MTRLQRWVLVGVVVAVAAFLMGVLGALTGNVPVELLPTDAQSLNHR